MTDHPSPIDFDPHLTPGLAVTGYVFDRKHALLAADANRWDGANIGVTGGSLTISFLSLNRASLSVRLLRSIETVMPYFTGRVLIVDQGSEEAELQQILAAVEQSPLRCEVACLGQNFGVAGGRNRTMERADTEWVMCLDNDIYFTRDPLRRMQRDMATLGCHFLNMPLFDSDGKRLFAKGGHIYLELIDAGSSHGGLHIGGGSCYPQTGHDGLDRTPYLSTFLFGGASVLNRESFLRLGGYDEAMFIGFEDIDFSIRLFRAGMKVGNCGAVALVHDHRPPENESDRTYERRRFSHEIIERSARHLEAKHGMTVWSDAVTGWLQESHRRLGLADPQDAPVPDATPTGAPVAARPAGKPRIALVVDVQDWAFGNISRQVMRDLGDRFEFHFIPMDLVENVARALILAEDCDLIHFFWRETLMLLWDDFTEAYLGWGGADIEAFKRRFVAGKALSTAVYDHLFLDDEGLAARREMFETVDGYYVASPRLKEIYDEIPGYPAPLAVLPDGVDRELFYPVRLARLASVAHRQLVVGWSGNSAWSGEIEDFKGVRTILEPALAQMRADGLPVRAHFADRQVRHIPHEEMVHYYASIDVYVCTSKIEGTPNPVLEAMACGVPVISTDVGIVAEAFGPKQREYLLKERSVPCLVAALRRLIDDPAELAALSAENLASIAAFDWRERTKGFADYFDTCLERRAARRRAAASAVGEAPAAGAGVGQGART